MTASSPLRYYSAEQMLTGQRLLDIKLWLQEGEGECYIGGNLPQTLWHEALEDCDWRQAEFDNWVAATGNGYKLD